MVQKIFRLYECIIPVKGYNRSILYDLNREIFYYVPNALCDFIANNNHVELETVLNKIENNVILSEYYEYLVKNEMVFIQTVQEDTFPPLDNVWYSSHLLNSVSIEISGQTEESAINQIISSLYDCQCFCISLIVRKDYSIDCFLNTLKFLFKSHISYIEIFIDYNCNYNPDILKNTLENNFKVKQIIIFNGPEPGAYIKIGEDILIHQFEEDISLGHTVIDLAYFHPNYSAFFEAQYHNIGLNRKFHIGASGDVYISLGFKKKMGNIFEDSLQTLATTEEIGNYWRMSKDKVEICKDCEYRYMCFDDSEIIKLEQSEFYRRKSECNYNPYISKWKGEEGYFTLADTGIKLSNSGIEIDHTQIKKINSELYESV